MKRRLSRLVASVAGLCVITVSSPALAAYQVVIQQTGDNVTATGSGSLNITGLSTNGETGIDPELYGLYGLIVFGSGSGPVYSVTGPSSFGGDVDTSPTSSTGPTVGINGLSGGVFFDSGYVSGTQFGTSTDVFADQTLASLGLTPGTYVYDLNSGANADTFTVSIGASSPSVPEPATWAMMMLGMGAIGFAMRRRQKVTTRVAYAI